MATNTRRPRGKRKRPLQNSPADSLTTCPVCLDPIIDATEDTEGQDAIFCESACNSWIHRQCAGLSQALFKKYEEREDPFYCPHCRLIIQDSQLQELRSMVENLSMEVIVLKAVVASSGHQINSEPHPSHQGVQTNGTASASTQETIVSKDMSEPDEGDGKFNVLYCVVRPHKPNYLVSHPPKNKIMVWADGFLSLTG